MYNKLNTLKNINLGNSVAENDKRLSEYFVDTHYVDELVADRYDIIKGVKGSGKTAMYVALCFNQMKYPNLENIKIVQAINLKGDPDFKKAFDNFECRFDVSKLIDAWKIYIINIAWKNIIDTCLETDGLGAYLLNHNIIEKKDGYIDKIKHALARVSPKYKQTTLLQDGSKFTNEVEFHMEKETEYSDEVFIDFNYIFSEIDKILELNDSKMWIMLDRLDDAFPDRTSDSVVALKSLLYAYKDIYSYDNFKLKIFIRDDVFNTVTEKGFTSLTHVASKTMASIEWSNEKLAQLLISRFLVNESFIKYLVENSVDYSLLNKKTCNDILNLIFKKQIDVGEKNPNTFNWIINHIRDGLGIDTPRDLINIVDKSRQNQIDELVVDGNFTSDEFLIGASAVRKAYTQVSLEKIETQLYAEYPELRMIIEKFKGSKAIHNEESLNKMLGRQWRSSLKKLINIGFIKERKNGWEVPFLYRPGLNIIQGKAYTITK